LNDLVCVAACDFPSEGERNDGSGDGTPATPKKALIAMGERAGFHLTVVARWLMRTLGADELRQGLRMSEIEQAKPACSRLQSGRPIA
jgi:hypothetical protein